MPGYHRAELSAEVRAEGEDAAAAALRAGGETGLAHEAGPDAALLAGGREEVLAALPAVLAAALDAGAHRVDVRLEAEGEAERFG